MRSRVRKAAVRASVRPALGCRRRKPMLDTAHGNRRPAQSPGCPANGACRSPRGTRCAHCRRVAHIGHFAQGDGLSRPAAGPTSSTATNSPCGRPPGCPTTGPLCRPTGTWPSPWTRRAFRPAPSECTCSREPLARPATGCARQQCVTRHQSRVQNLPSAMMDPSVMRVPPDEPTARVRRLHAHLPQQGRKRLHVRCSWV